MSDKERLEEIKNSFLEGFHRLFCTPWVSMPKENFDWLINRIEELEEENERLRALDIATTHELNHVDKINKRYREIIEKAIYETYEEYEALWIIETLRKALEGEE